MRTVKGKKSRPSLFGLRGGQIDVAIGVLAAAIIETRAHAEDGLPAGFSRLDLPQLTGKFDALLHNAIAAGEMQTLSFDELRALLTPEHLAELGIDAREFTSLLQADPAAALAKLEAAFATKLKLASFETAHKSVAHATDTPAVEGGAAAETGHGLSPALILGGVLAAGVGAGVLIGNHHGGNGGSQTSQAVNAPPLAVNDAITTNEGVPVTFDPRVNDTDADGDRLSVTAINGTAITTTTSVAVTGGVVSLTAAGALTFTPSAGFSGTPSFQYTISDGRGGTSTASVNLTVAHVNHAPVAVDDDVTIRAGTPFTFDPRANDTDADHDALTITAINGFAISVNNSVPVIGGMVSLLANGSLSFTPADGFIGKPAFTYTISDGHGGSAIGAVHLAIVAVQNVAVSDGYIAGATVFIDVNGDGLYNEGEPLGVGDGTGHYLIVGDGVGPLIAFGGTNLDTGLANTVIFRAPVGSSVVNPLTTVLDALVRSGMPIEQAEKALVASLGLPAGTDLLHLDILAATTDPVLQLAAQKAAAEIALTLTAAVSHGGGEGALLAKLAGLYAAGTPVDLSNPAVLKDLFTGINIPADQIGALSLSTASSNQTVGNASSLDGVSKAQQDAGNPAHDFAPVTQDDVAAGREGAPIAFDPRANDADPEGGPLTIVAINGIPLTGIVTITGGTIALSASGGLVFTPNAGFTGAVPAFTYTVSDTAGNQTNGRVDLTVTANNVPVALDDAASTAAGTAIVIDVLANDRDADGDSLRVIAANGVSLANGAIVAVTGGTVRLDGNGHIVFTPADGSIAASSFAYTVSDGHGGTATATVSVGVTVTGNTFAFGASAIDTVVANAATLSAAGIRHLDVGGAATTDLAISEAQARALIDAGLDFVDDDRITLNVTGGNSSATLKALQNLHVDTVNVRAGAFAIDAGAEGLAGLGASHLPSFTAQAGSAADVTLNIASGQIDSTFDISGLAPALHGAGISHLNVGGDGHLTLSAEQALALVGSGVDFADANDITISMNAADIGVVAGNAAGLGSGHIDHIDVTGDHIVIDENQASALISAGIDFVTDDDVALHTHGTHLSTSLQGLQSLHVDTVAGADGNISYKLDLGTIDELSPLPHFLDSDDVTVRLSDDQLAALRIADIDHLTALMRSLHDAGVDHIEISQPFEALSQDQIDTIAQLSQQSGLSFVYEPAAIANGADISSLMSVLEAHPVTAGAEGIVAISDAVTASMVESGALHSFLAETLVVDATHSGDHLLTSLKSLADLGVDSVLLPQGNASVYVDLGYDHATPSADELSQLLTTIDPAHSAEPLFSGAAHVGLVIDQATLDTLAGIDGSLAHLAGLGFTEIDVLGGSAIPDALQSPNGIEIKLIGVDDDLYDHLHHGH